MDLTIGRKTNKRPPFPSQQKRTAGLMQTGGDGRNRAASSGAPPVRCHDGFRSVTHADTPRNLWIGQVCRAVEDTRLAVREAPRARLRLPQDRRYFDAAICFTRYQPELALKLVLTDQSLAAYESLEAAIVNRARKPCVGSAKHVYFDPVQFRFYIADAVYRWAVAVSGLDTLIRDDAVSNRSQRHAGGN